MARVGYAAIAAIVVGVGIMVVSALWWWSGLGEALLANSGNTTEFYVQGYAFLTGAVLFVVGGLVCCLLACWWGARLILGRGEERDVR